MARARSLTTVCMVLVVACGGGHSIVADDGVMMTGSGSGPAGGVGLSADSADVPATVAGATASAGHELVVVTITLSNTGASSALSTNPSLFSLDTADALVHAPAAPQPSNGCDPTVSVATGGHVQCAIAFELPHGSHVTTIAYDDQHGHTATATVPPFDEPSGPSAACETVQGYGSSHKASCSSCIQAAGSGGACGAQTRDYSTSCTSCKQCNGSADPCKCEASCDSEACKTKFDDVSSCFVTACGSDC